MKQFGPANPTILDMGCGDGVLNKRMDDFEFSYFQGVDFSKVSIEKAEASNYPKAQFTCADAIAYVPDRNYDIIVFNEVFYYIPNSEKDRVLDLMLEHLNPGGLMIVSIFREGIGCWEYFKDDPRFAELVFDTVTTDKESTYWKIGAYRVNA